MKRILCYGDSNTYGANPAWTFTSGKSARYNREIIWPVLLGKALGKEYEIIEEGLPGRTTSLMDPITPHLNGKDYVAPCIISHYPFDMMIVMLGTNDLKANLVPSVLSCKMALEELIKTIRNPYFYLNGAYPPLLVVAPAPLQDNICDSQFYNLYDENSVEISRKLAAAYEQVARQYGCAFFDAGSVAKASKIDCIHLDKEGHASMAHALEKCVRNLIG